MKWFDKFCNWVFNGYFIIVDESYIIEMIEDEYGSGKAQLVSDILNADEQTIERIMKAMEKNDD
jgi:hypothetical protein